MFYIFSEEFYRHCLATRLVLQQQKEFDQLDLAGACGQSAVLINRHLQAKGIKATIASGNYLAYHHYFSLVQHKKETYIIDATATQFSRLIPPVVVGKLKDLGAYKIEQEISLAEMRDAVLSARRQKRMADKIEELAKAYR